MKRCFERLRDVLYCIIDIARSISILGVRHRPESVGRFRNRRTPVPNCGRSTMHLMSMAHILTPQKEVHTG